ncbi:ERF superfamily protein [Streptomyces sp. ScaeMP-e48]|uniref:ERF family protein n=1 Tax=Streptomyces sp. ScaeMP-e48 TaxID=1100823 RepID=UPI000823B29C|nr:ERF family protein [Streptomyces sp. ScaeMP-e48]SCK20391.1 ERF superfamily protein [Streptomyces sp. ScaeMP-e48]
MTTLADRAAAAAGRPDSTDPTGITPAPEYTPAPLTDPGIAEPGPDGPEQVPVWVAWSRVMGEVRGISKGDWYGKANTTGSYQFRGVDSALNAFGPACRLHGVLVLPIRTETAYRDVKTSGGKPSRECTATVTYRIFGPTGDSIEVQSAGESMDSADKGTAKALSTALRSLLFLGGLVPTNDVDPDASNVERGEAPPRTAVSYRDEILEQNTSRARLAQINYEIKQVGLFNASVVNEVGDDEQLGAFLYRIGQERIAGGAS